MLRNFNRSGHTLATLAGIFSVLVWSTTIAYSKSVMQTEGNYNAMFLIYFFSGFVILGMLLLWQKKELLAKWKKLSWEFYLKTGIFLLINNVLLYVAIGLTSNGNELLIVAIINYLWPIITYIIKVPMFHLRPKLFLFIISIILAVSGVILALSQTYSLEEFLVLLHSTGTNFWAYLLTFLTAISWGIYSNLIKKYNTDDDMAALPVIFVISGLLFLLYQLLTNQFSPANFSSLFTNYELIYMIIGPTSMGYLFWYIAMKKGNKNLVISLSFLIPVFSILFISLKFHKDVGLFFWIGAFLLITGAYLSYKAIPEV
jgi:drug/metabolite transporter (DMT)-like permease